MTPLEILDKYLPAKKDNNHIPANWVYNKTINECKTALLKAFQEGAICVVPDYSTVFRCIEDADYKSLHVDGLDKSGYSSMAIATRSNAILTLLTKGDK